MLNYLKRLFGVNTFLEKEFLEAQQENIDRKSSAKLRIKQLELYDKQCIQSLSLITPSDKWKGYNELKVLKNNYKL